MKDKTGSEEKEPMKDQTNAMSELAEQAVKNYEQALRSGLKLQQEASQWWSNCFNQNPSGQDWQKRWAGVANGLMPAAQKRMEEVVDLVEKNSQAGGELIKKAVEAAQTPVLADSQAKWVDVWTSSLGAAKSSAQAITQINVRGIDSCIEFIRQTTEIPKTA
ncbi:conserved hypothetical protein [Verrucomicrobia bacterium]|nr:conserved hypothetical protein [Verrucomicrobiota bacterium]